MMAGMMGGANHLGQGDRPSESHHWVPGIGWTFMPTYEEGNSIAEQSKAKGNEGFAVEVDGKSKADAEASGVSSFISGKSGGIPREQARAIRERQQSHGWYAGGMDHFNPSKDYTDNADYHGDWLKEASAYFDSIGRPQAVTPWLLTTDDSRMATYNAMREDNYNPFIGNEGAWVTPEGNDLRGSNNGTAEGYRDDSIAGWFKDQFAGKDRIGDRRDALRTLRNWRGENDNADGSPFNTATTRMNQRYFDDMGLADKFGLSFEDPRQAKYDEMVAGFSSPSQSTGGFMDAYNNARPRPPVAEAAGVAGPRPDFNPTMVVDVFPNSQPKEGGFLESYLKKKAETKPSVMSLMTELKDA